MRRRQTPHHHFLWSTFMAAMMHSRTFQKESMSSSSHQDNPKTKLQELINKRPGKYCPDSDSWNLLQ